MRPCLLLLVAALAGQSDVTRAAPQEFQPAPATRQLHGLTEEEAAALIAKLEDAQRRLKAGERQFFELLTGAIAYSDMTRSAPRDVFLQVPFREVWDIKKVRTDNALWQPYRLAYAPNGLGQLYWDIEVALGTDGNIQRVLMTFKPPAPF